MAEKESPATQEVEHSYLDVGPTGPRRWLLVVGAFVVLLALSSAFYGLYTINRGASPTLTPDPVRLTQIAAAESRAPTPIAPSATPYLITSTPSLSITVTATAEPPTYTIQQGDTLIGIAERLNVSVNALSELNQISGETIFPSQVLLVPPTVTPWPDTGPFAHTVSKGETLITLASLYRVTIEEIKTLNGLTSDAIFEGQRILVPANGVRPPTPTPTPEPWRPAIITGELDAAYSITTTNGRFILHIPPDTRASTARETSVIVELAETALDYGEKMLDRSFHGRIQLYVSDKLFEAPHTINRGFSVPEKDRVFLLHDGNGTPTERLYFATYALTHLIADLTFGDAAAPLLREGIAVYAAGQALTNEAAKRRFYLSPSQFCTALHHAGTLPRVTQSLEFKGHLGYLDAHLAAGCFVGYLIETAGPTAFTQVYARGDFQAVYGQTFEQLVQEWLASLPEEADDLPVDPDELATILSTLNDAYRRLWSEFAGTPEQLAAYSQLDRARIALLEGRLSIAQQHLTALEELLE